MIKMKIEVRAAVWGALMAADVDDKLARIAALHRAEAADEVDVDPACILLVAATPGRPLKPVLVHPARVPKRRLGTPAGRVALLHALAHIEFNAVNLALDIIARFAGLPREFYLDWLQVAAEEALHFKLLRQHLGELGGAYGELPAHDGLWEAAAKTREDVLARLGLVPRILEARGLDVTPGLQQRLASAGDHAAAAILARVLTDEIGHVAIANRWFDYFCAARGVEPATTFRHLCEEFGVRLPQPPFNHTARLAAGFTQAELIALAAPRTSA